MIYIQIYNNIIFIIEMFKGRKQEGVAEDGERLPGRTNSEDEKGKLVPQGTGRSEGETSPYKIKICKKILMNIYPFINRLIQ